MTRPASGFMLFGVALALFFMLDVTLAGLSALIRGGRKTAAGLPDAC